MISSAPLLFNSIKYEPPIINRINGSMTSLVSLTISMFDILTWNYLKSSYSSFSAFVNFLPGFGNGGSVNKSLKISKDTYENKLLLILFSLELFPKILRFRLLDLQLPQHLHFYFLHLFFLLLSYPL